MEIATGSPTLAWGASSGAAAAAAVSMKRRRLSDQNAAPAEDPHVAACAKRYRLSDENRDAPAYSQRQLEFLEQRKDAEAGRLRAEFAEALARKDGEIAGMTAEHVRVLEAFRVLRDEFDKAAGENKILKKAVAIQHDKQKQHDAQMAAFVDAAAKAAEHIKRIEQTNYALRAHLAAAGNSPGGDFAPPRPHLF